MKMKSKASNLATEAVNRVRLILPEEEPIIKYPPPEEIERVIVNVPGSQSR
jgi:hypothetical protein